ncbi:hypothetical protein PRIPAC_74601 [Pristionchus pacificus]|uniref:DUF7778 domain-containing protein n=1 Tax=Pristionchus pacificus TaxID=54126 RepID=A0A2A6D017_PRIPA|nr:hypothetical protein PRIPAC_74601 [Pristionchus pacificus]|eukprot:PDM83765.1 hypothetical protein PRIPAC_30252 [Pristionchus pacificus]
MTPSNPSSPVLNQFVVATDFIKMHTMPDHRVYTVQRGETIVEGDVNCYTRHKGFFRDVISSSSIRHIVLTKTGYLLVWMNFTKGFTLRLSRVTDISTETSALKYRTGAQQRCVVKMHFPFGTLNVILTNGQIDKWRNALIAGCDKKAAAPVPTSRNVLVETATDLSLVPPIPRPQRSIITSTVVLHPPNTQSINEWRNGWADVDTITPPSPAPFRYSASNITIPRTKTFHVTKSTVLSSSLLGTNGPCVSVSSPTPFVSSDDVVNHGESMEIRGQKNIVSGVKRSHTIDGGMSVPMENEVKMENDRYSAVDRWLRSQIEKRVKKLDGLTNPPEEIDVFSLPSLINR